MDEASLVRRLSILGFGGRHRTVGNHLGVQSSSTGHIDLSRDRCGRLNLPLGDLLACILLLLSVALDLDLCIKLVICVVIIIDRLRLRLLLLALTHHRALAILFLVLVSFFLTAAFRAPF